MDDHPLNVIQLGLVLRMQQEPDAWYTQFSFGRVRQVVREFRCLALLGYLKREPAGGVGRYISMHRYQLTEKGRAVQSFETEGESQRR